ncbi:MAG: DEAD/DEAH box helicase, partial [candidate division WOR-3 bacterium]
MSVFEFHSRVLRDYRDYIGSYFTIADDRVSAFVSQALIDDQRLWPDFLLQLSPCYARAIDVDALVQGGRLHPQAAAVFRTPANQPFLLYQHQVQALDFAAERASYVVTSGTGSGKSLTYFLPIIDALCRENEPSSHMQALIIYPMNALVNSQFKALDVLRKNYEERTGKPFPVTFAKYTGDTSDVDRNRIRQETPQILLTNYVMAELSLVRPEDQRFMESAAGGLKFLVLDELHTYRGRQGADVAMLIRRLTERCGGPDLVRVGTSATMVADRDAPPQVRREAVARFATSLFGSPVSADRVIEETLESFADCENVPTAQELLAGLNNPIPTEEERFRTHPLARWVEATLGIERERDGHLRRRIPKTLVEAARQLASETGAPLEVCSSKLRETLLVGTTITRPDGNRAFAFKLHQFIGQGGTLFLTLEPCEQRQCSLDGQYFADRQGRVFFPAKFCRQCGQEYYHVVRSDGSNRYEPHPFGIGEGDDLNGMPGYLMLAPTEGDWEESQLPEEWRDRNGRIKREYRDRIPVATWVTSEGVFTNTPQEHAVKCWFQPSPFSICLTCGEFYTARERAFTKLATLSNEGRSSATTILAASLLRHAGRDDTPTDKLLTFTDNRQDASLQAGHFNDFIHVAVLRSALYASLRRENELAFDRLAEVVVGASGLELR